jgi:hypothetical protein
MGSPFVNFTHASSDDNKLDFVFLLHANQANVPYGDVANDLCYYHVLSTMRTHPDLHFPLHISGTLLTDLQWFNQSTVELIRDGVQDGQFEIIGSTFSQNIIYSITENFDNQIQIEKHQQVIDALFSVTPTGFWNPERCWNQTQYIPLLVDAGYEYTFIEDQILAQSVSISGYDEFKVRETAVGEKSLNIINDDKTIIEKVDAIAATIADPTDPTVIQAVDNLISYLYAIYQADINDDYLVFYGQDMEAWGLWQAEGSPYGSDNINRVMSRLDYLFTRLEQESGWLNVVTPAEYFAGLPIGYNFEVVNAYVDGQAQWMQVPSQNAGYNDWFDFNINDSRLIDYRDEFEIARTRLKAIEQYIGEQPSEVDVIPANRLMSFAKFQLSSYQFEFGCIGCYFPWYYATKLALLTAEAANYSLSPLNHPEVIQADWDKDNYDDFILRNQKGLFIFSRYGGRLIAWFDIVQGKVLLSGDIAASYGSIGGQSYPPPQNTPLSNPIEQIDPSDLWGRTTKSYRIRDKSFVDSIDLSSSGLQDYWNQLYFDSTLTSDSIIFEANLYSITLTKQYIIEDDQNELKIIYNYHNGRSGPISPKFILTFNPDNEDILLHGKNNLYEESSPSEVTTEKPYQLLVNNKLSLLSLLFEFTSSSKVLQISPAEINPMFGISYNVQFQSIGAGATLTQSFILHQNAEYLSSLTPQDNKPKISAFPLFYVLIFSIASCAIIIRLLKEKNTTTDYSV